MTEPNATAPDPGYDAILIVGFGGPEKPDDVMPFLENVTRGRNVPRERLLEVAEHYHHFGGVSPINGQVRDLIAALRPELDRQGVALPIYWGNRNWHPMLADTVAEMTRDGVKRAVAVVLAAYSSYSSCRQYREDVERAREAVGPEAPRVDKVRVFYNHPDFIAANADRVASALDSLPADLRDVGPPRLHRAQHPRLDGRRAPTTSDSSTRPAGSSPRRSASAPTAGELVYQSRSGRPTDPWLEPDILDHLRDLHAPGRRGRRRPPGRVPLRPHGSPVRPGRGGPAGLRSLGLTMARSATVGTHPRFVSMLVELIRERVDGTRRASGRRPFRCEPRRLPGRLLPRRRSAGRVRRPAP